MKLYSRNILFPQRYKYSVYFYHQWIVFLITSFVRVQCVTSLSDNLMWNITSNPVTFGKTAELSCYIFNYDTTCTDELRQWIGGQQYSSLCQNMRCSDGTKYHVKLKTACSYTLMISNFSMYDVNCDYSCFYGTHSFRKRLQLNSNDFVSFPRIKHKNMSLTGGLIHINISMEDVYPSPKCHALLVGKNITNSLVVIPSKREYFYDVELQVNQPINHCNGNATINCYLGKEEVVVLNEYIDDCSDIHTSHPTGNSIFPGDQVVGIIVGIVAVIILICIAVYLRRKHRKYANEGSATDKCYFTKVIILGAHHVEKAILVQRLLNKNVDGESRTDDSDVVVHRCKINIDDGKWTDDKGECDDWADGMHKAISKNESRKNQFSKMSSSAESCSAIKPCTNIWKNKATEGNKISNSGNEYDISTKSISYVKDNEDETNNEIHSVLLENEENINLSSVILSLDLMTVLPAKMSTSNNHSNQYALCGLWDIQGLKEFYAIHQAFLTNSSVYLVVADITDDIFKPAVNHDIEESVQFWLNNIRFHQAVKTGLNKTINDVVDIPVIVVFTGTDRYEKANMGKTSLKERKIELATHLCRIMGNSSVHHHFLVSNLTDPDEEFEKIRLEISTAAKRINHWGERVPSTWVRLEYVVAIQRHDGKNFISLSDMVMMAKHPKINIQDNDEVLRFLRFQHESGNIIYFDDIPDLILLHPQWIADAFRCLVADEICDKLQHRSDWKTCVQNRQIHYDLINELFKSNCGNQFSEQAENLLILMEKMDVLFKISKTGLYIIPSRIPSVSFDKVCQQIGVEESICKRTSWLCLKFTFLPPAFFYHMYVYLLGEYQPTKMEKQSMAIFRELCVFDIDKYETKLMLTMSTDTVALQLLSFSKEEEQFGIVCSNIRKNILRKAELIRQRYKFEILYKLHFKCSISDYYEDTISYQDLKSSPSYWCKQHKTQHQSVEIYMPWMMNKDKIQ